MSKRFIFCQEYKGTAIFFDSLTGLFALDNVAAEEFVSETEAMEYIDDRA